MEAPTPASQAYAAGSLGGLHLAPAALVLALSSSFLSALAHWTLGTVA